MLVSRGQCLEISQMLAPQSAERFARWIGVAAYLRNQKTAERMKRHAEWKAEGSVPAAYPKTDQKVAHFQTEECPWVCEVPSQIRRNVGESSGTKRYKPACGDSAAFLNFVKGIGNASRPDHK